MIHKYLFCRTIKILQFYICDRISLQSYIKLQALSNSLLVPDVCVIFGTLHMFLLLIFLSKFRREVCLSSDNNSTPTFVNVCFSIVFIYFYYNYFFIIFVQFVRHKSLKKASYALLWYELK